MLYENLLITAIVGRMNYIYMQKWNTTWMNIYDLKKREGI